MNDYDIKKVIKAELQEDIRSGDKTSDCFVPPDIKAVATVRAKEEGVLAGGRIGALAFNIHDENLEIERTLMDGHTLKKGDVILKIRGNGSSLLEAERTALNFLSHLSGVATLTRKFVEKTREYETQILGTRKTTPMLRQLEKYAIKIAGGRTHRFGLYETVLIKENHIFLNQNFKQVLKKIKTLKENNPSEFVEIEVDSLDRLQKVLDYPIDRIMLDNFGVDQVKKALYLREKKNVATPFEVSGGITLKNVEEYAKLGVEFISTGTLTHSSHSLDISMKIDKKYKSEES